MERTLAKTPGNDRLISMVKALYPWLVFNSTDDKPTLWIELNLELKKLIENHTKSNDNNKNQGPYMGPD